MRMGKLERLKEENARLQTSLSESIVGDGLRMAEVEKLRAVADRLRSERNSLYVEIKELRAENAKPSAAVLGLVRKLRESTAGELAQQGEIEKLRAELAELREAAEPVAMVNECLCDPLNPCWDNRPADVPGKHWGGGEACINCSFRAALARMV
jgi:hypothetical protein